MNYTVATVLLAVSGVFVLGASEMDAQRGEHRSAALMGNVLALSQQELASAREECEPRAERQLTTVAYCNEVQRALESQPLQIVLSPPLHEPF